MDRLLAKSIVIVVAAVLIALCVGSAFAVYSVNATAITVNITATMPTTRTVYFTNNNKWDSVYAYVWTAATNSPEAAWPGTAMTWVEKNDMNEDVYRITFSYASDRIIFNDNNGNQTVDIDLTQIGSANAFYISGNNGSGYTVGTWTK